MKHLVLTALAIFLTTIASAKCGYGVYCLNESTTLNKNGLIILTFAGFNQALVGDLNKKYAVWLYSSTNKIKLQVVEVYKGEWKESLVVLKPAAALKVNDTYTLKIDSIKYQPERYDTSMHQLGPVKFRINNTTDNEPPVFNSQPTEQKKSMYGGKCGGIGSWVHFYINGQDKSELFVKATVKNLTTGKITSYILNIDDGTSRVGGGYCDEEAFNLQKDDRFEVKFQLFDQSGNTSTMTAPISFTRPAYRNIAREWLHGKSIEQFEKEDLGGKSIEQFEKEDLGEKSIEEWWNKQLQKKKELINSQQKNPTNSR